MSPPMDPSTDIGSLEPDGDAPLGATVSRREDGPDQCTIFPLSVACRDERRSAWITAEGDAFVDPVTVR